MFNPTQVIIESCAQHLQAGYRRTYGNLNPHHADFLAWTANVALLTIANSDALYHNVEHTVFVTLVGQEILQGKQIREGNVTPEDWLNAIVACLFHDIGFVRGICKQDETEAHLYATGIEDVKLALPPGATDASLMFCHVDRGKLFAQEYFGMRSPIDLEAVQQGIELTRFPVPAEEDRADSGNYPALVRAADLIGQLSDPRYLQKISALFYEFEETGTNKTFGYRTPDDLQKNYPCFYWNAVAPHIQTALRYLEATQSGKQIVANLYANVFRVEHGS